MKVIIPILAFCIFLISATLVANLDFYMDSPQSESHFSPDDKNINKTIVITKERRLKNYAFDQALYNYQRDKVFEQRIDDIMGKLPYYEDKKAKRGPYLPIPSRDYKKYYECYDREFNRFYKDYDYYNPCLD